MSKKVDKVKKAQLSQIEKARKNIYTRQRKMASVTKKLLQDTPDDEVAKDLLSIIQEDERISSEGASINHKPYLTLDRPPQTSHEALEYFYAHVKSQSNIATKCDYCDLRLSFKEKKSNRYASHLEEEHGIPNPNKREIGCELCDRQFIGDKAIRIHQRYCKKKAMDKIRRRRTLHTI